MPHRLEDFTRAKKKSSEYAALSDNEESESGSGSESESLTNALTKSTKTITEWEWRFHLRLEDASPGDEPKKSLWVVVDNQSAQMLLNLDASDLSTDDDNLARLRQKLWLLWGDMEEHKATIENRALRARRSNNASAPPHSDDEDESGKKKPAQVSNRPFGCCIRQYGAAVKEEDVKKADAGSAKRWERMFGLFGTRISEM
jgi:hypothetical protein